MAIANLLETLQFYKLRKNQLNFEIIGLQSQKTEAWSWYDVGSTGNYCAKSSYDSESTDTHYLVSPKVPLGGSISFFAKAESDFDKSVEAGFLFDVLVLVSNDDQINPYEIVTL